MESDTGTIRESALQISTTFVSIVRLVLRRSLCFARIRATETNIELNCDNGIYLHGSLHITNLFFSSFSFLCNCYIEIVQGK